MSQKYQFSGRFLYKKGFELFRYIIFSCSISFVESKIRFLRPSQLGQHLFNTSLYISSLFEVNAISNFQEHCSVLFARMCTLFQVYIDKLIQRCTHICISLLSIYNLLFSHFSLLETLNYKQTNFFHLLQLLLLKLKIAFVNQALFLYVCLQGNYKLQDVFYRFVNYNLM